MRAHSQRHLENSIRLAINKLVTADIKVVERNEPTRLLTGKSDLASRFDWLASGVFDLELDNLSFTGSELKDVLGLTFDDGALLTPLWVSTGVWAEPSASAGHLVVSVMESLLLLPFLRKLGAELAHLLSEFLSVEFSIAVVAVLFNKLLNHTAPGHALAFASGLLVASTILATVATTAGLPSRLVSSLLGGLVYWFGRSKSSRLVFGIALIASVRFNHGLFCFFL